MYHAARRMHFTNDFQMKECVSSLYTTLFGYRDIRNWNFLSNFFYFQSIPSISIIVIDNSRNIIRSLIIINRDRFLFDIQVSLVNFLSHPVYTISKLRMSRFQRIPATNSTFTFFFSFRGARCLEKSPKFVRFIGTIISELDARSYLSLI